MKQRKFQIDFGVGCIGQDDWGAEYTLGAVSRDFAIYWEPSTYNDANLIRHLHTISDEDFASEDYDDNSPLITDECEEKEEQPIWYDINDLEHIYGIYFLGSAYVVEIGDDGNQIPDTEIEIDPHILHTRQTGIDVEDEPPVVKEGFDPDDEEWEDTPPELIDPDIVWQPVLEFYNEEKGQFHEWIAETDGEDFDPHKLVIALVYIDSFGRFDNPFVEVVFYDEEEIEAEVPLYLFSGGNPRTQVGWTDITGRKQMKEIGLGMWDIKQQNYENSWADCRESIVTSISGGETRIKS